MNRLKRFIKWVQKTADKVQVSEDGKPTTMTAVLMRDSCSRLLGEFSDRHLETCHHLVIVWRDEDGSIQCASSENCAGLDVIGMISVANNIVINEGRDDAE